jgi:hypothetical protein
MKITIGLVGLLLLLVGCETAASTDFVTAVSTPSPPPNPVQADWLAVNDFLYQLWGFEPDKMPDQYDFSTVDD